MALGAPNFLGGDGGNLSSVPVNVACTPPAGQTIYVFAAGTRGASIAPPSFTISDTDGHVWTTVMDAPTPTGPNRTRGMVFQAVGKGNPTTISVTSAVGILAIDVVAFPGADTDFSNSNIAFSTSNPLVPSIAAIGATSGTFTAYYLMSPGGAVTPVTGFTSLFSYSTTTIARHEGAYALSSPPTSASWTTPGGGGSLALLFEVKAAAGSPDITGTLDATLSGGYVASIAGTVEPLPVVQQPGGGYRKHRPIIYVDAKGKPVDLKTYKARAANEAMQAARAIEPKSSKALAKALSSNNNDRIAEQAHRLALATADAKLSELLLILEQLAIREAEEDEEAAIMLLLA